MLCALTNLFGDIFFSNVSFFKKFSKFAMRLRLRQLNVSLLTCPESGQYLYSPAPAASSSSKSMSNFRLARGWRLSARLAAARNLLAPPGVAPARLVCVALLFWQPPLPADDFSQAALVSWLRQRGRRQQEEEEEEEESACNVVLPAAAATNTCEHSVLKVRRWDFFAKRSEK